MYTVASVSDCAKKKDSVYCTSVYRGVVRNYSQKWRKGRFVGGGDEGGGREGGKFTGTSTMPTFFSNWLIKLSKTGDILSDFKGFV